MLIYYWQIINNSHSTNVDWSFSFSHTQSADLFPDRGCYLAKQTITWLNYNTSTWITHKIIWMNYFTPINYQPQSITTFIMLLVTSCWVQLGQRGDWTSGSGWFHVLASVPWQVWVVLIGFQRPQSVIDNSMVSLVGTDVQDDILHSCVMLQLMDNISAGSQVHKVFVNFKKPKFIKHF